MSGKTFFEFPHCVEDVDTLLNFLLKYFTLTNILFSKLAMKCCEIRKKNSRHILKAKELNYYFFTRSLVHNEEKKANLQVLCKMILNPLGVPFFKRRRYAKIFLTAAATPINLTPTSLCNTFFCHLL